MRVRHLHSHLQEQGLLNVGKVDSLQGLKIGVDAVYWLRSIQALKDPFADALGGIPPGIFGFVDKELDLFKKAGITPLFVFQGVAPGPQHSMFVTRMDQQMEQAWAHLGMGQNSEAQKCFAMSTSRINGDFVYFIFHHIRHRGFECLQAPYSAGAQLAHFAEQGVVQATFGPPGLLLYGIAVIIINLAFPQQTFSWVELQSVLNKWQVREDQFVDACMLAGTEYCMTYPYLNSQHMQSQPGRFNFDAAVQNIKQVPLTGWMTAFPSEDMRNDHVDGYCICKVLVQSSPVLHLADGTVRPLGPGGAGVKDPQVPHDFHLIMGEKLPNNLYCLLLQGIISYKIPQALAKGEWTDKSQPLVDTKEFRDLLSELVEYREIALGLVARHLAKSFQDKKVVCKAFCDPPPIRQLLAAEVSLPEGTRVIKPRSPMQSLRWSINKDQLDTEMKRQNTNSVDFKFCMNWHRHAIDNELPLIKNLRANGLPICSNDLNSLAALVHFMVLEHLDLISSEDGGMTVLGNVLCDTPREFQEPCLVALEMMKFGILSGEPFEAADPARPFPESINYHATSADPRRKSMMLLARVMSLVPMKLKNAMWNAEVDFDLAAFHSLVRILKRALRHLVEASLASILLKDLPKMKLLPPGFMCSSPLKDDHMLTPAALPTFMLPRACMGILVLRFLEYEGPPDQFASGLVAKFPCCVQPVEDLKVAFSFWQDLKRCVDTIAEPLGAEELAADMQIATELLQTHRARLGI